MKHVFIVNPKAGKNDHTNAIREHLNKYEGKIDYFIYNTKGPKDATSYVRECLKSTNETIRFYALLAIRICKRILNWNMH